MRRKPLAAGEQSKFTRETLLAIAADMNKKHYGGVNRINLTDDMQPGLRALVQKDGRVSLHANYTVGESRPMMFLGQITDAKAPDYITIQDARELTKTVRALGDRGVDPQDGLHARLLRELREQGTKWRPK